MSGEGTARGGRIIPALRYRNAAAAIDWLCDAFGFERKMVVPGEGGRVAHAELTLGNGMIMLGDGKTEYGRLDRSAGHGRSGHARHLCRGGGCRRPLYAREGGRGGDRTRHKTQDYGGRDYTARDLEGHVWTFGTYDPGAS
jgi:uncharacterized glyoxalase superfamily protein PhnB